MPQVGPITIWVISTTLTPASGNPVPVIIVSVLFWSCSSSLAARQTRLSGAPWKI
jgi:hypothetical protein